MQPENNFSSVDQTELKSEKRTKGLVWLVVGFLAGALIMGGVLYFSFYNPSAQKQERLNWQIDALQAQVRSLQQSKEKMETPTTDSSASTAKKTSLTKIKDDGRFVFYDGVITVSGKYREVHPQNPIGGQLCFYPDSEAAALIPRDGSGVDDRAPWFCFKDQVKAKEKFGIDEKKIFGDNESQCIEGQATVQVSNYVVDKLEGETFDTASLDKIVSRGSYSTRCE